MHNKEKIIIKTYKSPFGELIIGSFNETLCICDWKYRTMRQRIDLRIKKSLNTDYLESINGTKVIDETITQLDEYFNFKRKKFNIPLMLLGTTFQKSVWQELQTVAFGNTATYKEQAKKLGNEKAVRAVATANGANAISIIIPCHRIIGSSGDLVGYAGGLSAKKKLLSIENDIFTNIN